MKKYNEIQVDFFLYDLEDQIKGQTPKELKRVIKALEGYESIITVPSIRENLHKGIKAIEKEIENRC